MSSDRSVEPQSVPLPEGSRIASVYDKPNLADAFSIELPRDTARDPEALARFIFSNPPRWVATLMAVRDAVVCTVGLKTGRSLRPSSEQRDRIGIFRLYEAHPQEVILGEDDKHLDFRASVLYREPRGPACHASVVVSTVVRCHNLFGRAYIMLVAPFHRRVVASFLRRASRMGWPREVPSSPVVPGFRV